MFWKRHFNEVCFKAYQATCNNHYNENRSKKKSISGKSEENKNISRNLRRNNEKFIIVIENKKKHNKL